MKSEGMGISGAIKGILYNDQERGGCVVMMLMMGLVFGSLGLAYAVYGKKGEDPIFLMFGVLLMGYSYFVPDPLWGSLLGIALGAAPFMIKHYF